MLSLGGFSGPLDSLHLFRQSFWCNVLIFLDNIRGMAVSLHIF